MAERRPAGDSISFDTTTEYQNPDILTPLQTKIFNTFVPAPDEETPFKQRPRPPEAETVESRLNSRTSFSQRLSSVIQGDQYALALFFRTHQIFFHHKNDGGFLAPNSRNKNIDNLGKFILITL